MKLYVAMIEDRHTDPEPFVFSTPEAAVEFARSQAVNGARGGFEVEEEPIDGWLFYARYSDEGDSVWVIEKTLDTP
jgi:hypothetical protein